MKLEEKLMKLRKNNIWSQEELAEKLDVTRQTISKWELGQTIPDTENLSKIATIFGISVNDLLDENTDPIVENSKNNNNNNNNNNGDNSKLLKILILIIILVFVILGIGAIILNKLYNKTTHQVEPKSIIEMFQENSIPDLFNELFGQMNNLIIQDNFNNTFKTLYYGDVDGAFMANFLDEIIKTNEKNNDRIITLKYKDIETSNAQEIRSVKDIITTNKVYEISYEYDEDGFISKAIIIKEKFTEFATSSFNSTFQTLYFGSTNGSSMNNFIDAVIKSNEENPDNIIIVKYNNIETSNSSQLRDLKSNFKNSKTYEISYEYDNTGLINKAIIVNEKMTEFAINSFNNNFKILYFGSQNGFFMNNFIDAVIKSNEENPDNIITVSYNGAVTSDANELRNMKKTFSNQITYEISYEYNEDGLINRANISR